MNLKLKAVRTLCTDAIALAVTVRSGGIPVGGVALFGRARREPPWFPSGQAKRCHSAGGKAVASANDLNSARHVSVRS